MLAMDTARDARAVRQPVLVMLGAHDRAVRHASSMKVYEALGGPKELVTLDSGHSMWADRDKEKAIRLVDEWLARHLAA